MKKFIFLLLFITTLQSGNLYAGDCYLLITKPGPFDSSSIFEISSALLSQFFEPIKEFPPGGVGKNDCLYKLAILEGKKSLSVSISGKTVNSIGNADSKDLPALQLALLRAIHRAKPESQPKVCASYRTILTNECKDVKPPEQEEEEGAAGEGGDILAGIWFMHIEEEKEDLYLNILMNADVQYCFLKENDPPETWTAPIEDDSIIFDKKPFKMIFTDDSLILKGDYTMDLSAEEKAPAECGFHTEETLTQVEEAEGIWHLYWEDDKIDVYLQISNSGRAWICELVEGKLDYTSETQIRGKELIWGDETLKMKASGGNLVLKGEEGTDVLDAVEKAPKECDFP